MILIKKSKKQQQTKTLNCFSNNNTSIKEDLLDLVGSLRQ